MSSVKNNLSVQGREVYFLVCLDWLKARPISYPLQASAAYMPIHSLMQQQTFNRLLWSGILAVGFLWILALGSVGDQIKHVGSDVERDGRVVSVDMPLHASSEHSLSLKRFLNRYKDQPKSADPIEPIWVLSANEHISALPLTAANTHKLTIHSPHFSLLQLQTLNISRAPPIV